MTLVLTSASVKTFGTDDGFPVGGIALWYGSASAVPQGWQLCLSPDLRGKFAVGQLLLPEYSFPSGSETHLHVGEISSNVSAYHTHTISGYTESDGKELVRISTGTTNHAHINHAHAATSWAHVTAKDTGHMHTPSGISDQQNNLPPYKRLYYIIRSS